MSVNKNYIVAGMLATTCAISLSNISNSYASEVRVTTERVHFRIGAGTNYTSMGVLDKGTKVNYISQEGNWTKVEYNSKTGYIYSEYLKKEETIQVSSTMYVTPDSGLNVRKGPGTSYEKIKTLSKGTEVTVCSTDGGWSKIISSGVEGYVSNEYLSSINPSISNESTSNESTLETSIMYVTPDSGLNVRKGPGVGYAKLKTLSKGTKVTVYSTENGWSKIKVSGIEGYVSSKYLSSINSSSSDESVSGESNSNESTSQVSTMYVITDSGLNVRKGPGTSYLKVGKLSKGTEVTVYSTENGWSKVKSSGLEGYVSSEYLSSTKPSSSSSIGSSSTNASVEDILNFASQQIGKPYVWGAEGPSSFDCSGFTYYVYKNVAGISLPRTSVEQSRYGTTVSKSNLKAGDLVFFDTSGSNNGAVSHVGIYAGGGQLIHASSSKKQIVKVSMETSYWNNAYVTAKRVL